MGENPNNIPFNYVISHEKKLKRQSHKLVNIRHLNFSTFRVYLHRNTRESAVFGKKEEQQQKKIFKTAPAICFPGLDYKTHKVNVNLSSDAAVVGTVHIPKHTDQITDWASHYQEYYGKNVCSGNFCPLLQF